MQERSNNTDTHPGVKEIVLQMEHVRNIPGPSGKEPIKMFGKGRRTWGGANHITLPQVE